MKGEEVIATDAEALAYVSNASLSQPIASDWVEIYQYLLTRVMGGESAGRDEDGEVGRLSNAPAQRVERVAVVQKGTS